MSSEGKGSVAVSGKGRKPTIPNEEFIALSKTETARSISDRFGISRQAVWVRANRLGVKTRQEDRGEKCIHQFEAQQERVDAKYIAIYGVGKEKLVEMGGGLQLSHPRSCASRYRQFKANAERAMPDCENAAMSFLDWYSLIGQQPVGKPHRDKACLLRHDKSLGYTKENCYVGPLHEACRKFAKEGAA